MMNQKGNYVPTSEALILPSDYIKQLLTSGTTNDKIKTGNITVCKPELIDVTMLYNWYVEYIEKFINGLYHTRNPVLFLYVVESILIKIATDNYLMYQEGITDNSSVQDIDLFLEEINGFINKNNLPIHVDLGKTLDGGAIEALIKQIRQLFNTNNDDYVYLPIGNIQLDPIIYKNNLTQEDYNVRYPHGIEIQMKVTGVDMNFLDDNVWLIEDAVLRCSNIGEGKVDN